MINHTCSCACCSKCGGPTKGQETCPGCGKQFFVYRSGSYDWEPKLCADCIEKDTLDVVGHIDGLIKDNKPTGDKMKYGSDEFKEAALDAEEYCKHSELAHDDTEELSFAKALIAIYEYAIFLENELTEEARINGQGAQRELSLRTKIDGLQSKINCFEILIKEFEKVAEAKEKVISEVKAHFKTLYERGDAECDGIEKALSELEALQRGEK